MWKAARIRSGVRRIVRWMADPLSDELVQVLDRGMLVLTGNDRAARSMTFAWDRLQVERGRTSWQPCQVLSWRTWTQLLWKKLLLEGRVTALLLTSSQEKRVWQKVLESEPPAGTRLHRTNSLAALAATTWHRLCSYRGRQQLLQQISSLRGDSLQFARWARSFEAFCARESLLSESLLEEELLRLLGTKDLQTWHDGILLLGFDRFTPAQNTLLERCRSLGTTFDQVRQASHPSGFLISTVNEAEELRGCARWIQSRLQQNPLARIGLIVSDLQQQMSMLDSVLREHLSPRSIDITIGDEDAPYEFSLGTPLSHEPMVRCALDLIAWALAPLAIRHISRLLLSPYFADCEGEMLSRAEFDATDLRQHRRLRPEASISDFLEVLRQSSAGQSRVPLLAHTVGEMERALSQAQLQPRGFGEWSEWMRAWLVRAQWCTTGTIRTSREYQVHERWENALDEIAGLDFLGEEVSLTEALLELERLAQEIIFAPASTDAPVQVLGPLEAAGSQFEVAWILKAGEFSWPPRTSAVPLLPWSLQRELGMPGTDAASDRGAAQEMTERLAASAQQVMFSYAESLSNGRSQRAAIVVRQLQLGCAGINQITSPEQARHPVELDRIADVIVLPSLPTDSPRGGARVLELQAACGFRAFSELRLGSTELRERPLGFNAMERGIIVHDALETFWRGLQTQRDLVLMNDDQRDIALRRAVEASIARVSGSAPGRWEAAYLEAQQTRLLDLLRSWLLVELRRPEFTVTSQEKQQIVTIGPLRLSLRVDRVDQVDGRQVIIDYKTGIANTSEWLGERLDKPQVPLYAILATQAVSQSNDAPSPLGAVGFAQIRAGLEMDLKGFQSSPGILSSGSQHKPAKMDAESFAAQIEQWQGILERLATEFAEGDVRVHPKRYPTTCERCGQRLLCRVNGSLFGEAFEAEMTEACTNDE